MKKSIFHNVSAIAIVGIVFVGFFLMVKGNIATDKDIPAESDFDWNTVYPIEGANQADSDTEDKHLLGFVRSINGKLSKLQSTVANWYTHFPEYDTIQIASQKLNLLWSTAAKYDRMPNGMQRKGDYLTFTEAALDFTNIDNLLDFKSYLDDKKIPFLYNSCPQKVCKSDDVNPSVNVNVSIDAFLSTLEKNHVDYIDYRKLLHEQGLDHHSMFYSTDHHWNIQSGFWAAKQLVDYCNNHYNTNLDDTYFNEDLYTTKTYTNAMYGSMGSSVGRGYIGPEDFSVLVPQFDTNFYIEALEMNISKTGSFSEVMFNEEMLQELSEKNGGYAYGHMASGNRGLFAVKNLNNKTGKKLLVLRDSFSLAMIPYLSLSFDELYFVDIRPENGNFNGSVRALIEEVNPDLVMMLYYLPLVANSKIY